MLYGDFVSRVAVMAAISGTDADFLTAVPALIDDAEQRIYRELDFLDTRQTVTGGPMAIGNRIYVLPTSFVVIERINLILPAGDAPGQTGSTRKPLIPRSAGFIDAVTGASPNGAPAYFAMVTNVQIILGPAPDAAYQTEITGTLRPAPLSPSNTSTWLSLNLPDLMLAAGMVAMAAYQKNFGQMGDNPQMALGWEGHYQALKQSALVEEWRRKFQGPKHSARQPSAIVTAPE